MFIKANFMENTGIISVFKTNIPGTISGVCEVIQHFPGIRRCTLDAEDCDKVLRIESENACLEMVLQTVRDMGFFIEEMPD